MKKTYFFLTSILLAPAGAWAGPAMDSLFHGAPAVSVPLPAAQKGSAPDKEWTVMVYMNGKSNIEPFALADLNRFETAGSSEKINIVAEIGRSKGLENDTTADGDWAGVRRYFVVKDADPEHLASPVLAELGNADMGDWRQAAAFVKWAKAAYPAKKYLFIIWDHGWGWIDPRVSGDNLAGSTKSISHDFVTGHYIHTTEMGNIFREAGKVDMYVSMACFMQMAEVAYEIKDGADVIVGSEEVIQLASLNWEGFLSRLAGNPGAGAETAGAYMTDSFREMYSRPEYLDMLQKTKYGTQLSAIRAAKLPLLAEKARAWYELAMASGDSAALARAKAEVLRFEVGDEVTDPDKRISFYGDLYNFVELAGLYSDRSRPGAAALAAAGEDLKKFITSELTISNACLGRDRTGKEYSGAHGVAIDIPGRPGNLIEYYHSYPDLAFAKASKWERFVEYLETIPD